MSPELAALAATAFIQLAAVVWSQRALEADIGHDAANRIVPFGITDREAPLGLSGFSLGKPRSWQ